MLLWTLYATPPDVFRVHGPAPLKPRGRKTSVPRHLAAVWKRHSQATFYSVCATRHTPRSFLGRERAPFGCHNNTVTGR